MAPHPYNGKHFGLLVEDIDETVEYMTRRLGIEFGRSATIPFVMKGNDRKFEQDVRACYATDRHVELVQAADRGAFDRSRGLGLHHYGGVVADLGPAVADQRSHGNEVDWELSHDGQLIAVFFKGGGPLPGRLELVTSNAPPLFAQYAD